ncbi:ComF family protein [Leucothrix arctica]|uniref:Amidophosphoribosyltransferase n=1 Tax=Leucothrix arctica TaxID=1481894 RepID=A0A317CNH0_9GAMM|nr:ComF family protein [Leucothrix arctica]PWQ99023.1 amidophosphoribosyltransferase [Leucothrix arctica]
MKVTISIRDSLQRLFTPSCLLCDASCSETGNAGISLCMGCQQDLPWILHSCNGCALPIESTELDYCSACQQSPWLSDQVICFVHYASPVDYLIKKMKFGHKLSAAKVLGRLMAQQIVQGDFELPDAILPVPLHKKRLRSRGFNQAQELYREINKTVAIPLLKGVERTIYTEAQTLVKGDERAKNLRGVFSVKLGSTVPKHVVILDDVVTTGATSNELSKVLKAAGVEKVTVWAVARATPN